MVRTSLRRRFSALTGQTPGSLSSSPPLYGVIRDLYKDRRTDADCIDSQYSGVVECSVGWGWQRPQVGEPSRVCQRQLILAKRFSALLFLRESRTELIVRAQAKSG